MIGIALVLGVPLAILVALYLVSPQRWRKVSVPADALPFRDKAFSALKRAALAWAWGMLAMLLVSAGWACAVTRNRRRIILRPSVTARPSLPLHLRCPRR